MSTERVTGAELRPGDVIILLHSTRVMITALRDYNGPLAYLFKEGAKLATLVPAPTGITIDCGDFYERVIAEH